MVHDQERRGAGKKIDIASIAYLNAAPFRYGIERSERLCSGFFLLPSPGDCETAFREKKAGIVLLPVAALPSFGEDLRMVTPYCIGADASVRTVVLVSDAPLEKISRIHLDAHSRTSVQLVRILARELWKISPQWCDLTDYARLDRPEEGDAFLLIGDKVFAQEARFRYNRDLAGEWHILTGLPFVFAVWVARLKVPQEDIAALEEALAYGVEHIDEAIVHCGHANTPYARDYLMRNIDYRFDDLKRRALRRFFELRVED